MLSYQDMKVKDCVNITQKNTIPLPFFEVGLPAGFPSPADDYLEQSLDLHELLIEASRRYFFCAGRG